jgi:hypothetical protein
MTLCKLRKKDIREFLLDYLVPRLEDQDWLLLDDESLVKVRDETLFGFGAQRSDFGPSFVFWVFIRPLYWPPAEYALGITMRIGSWCHWKERLGEGWVDLGSPELAEHASGLLAPVINTRIAPFLAQFPDGASVLRYASSWRHATDPMFGWIGSSSGLNTEMAAYMRAWSGDRRRARFNLRGAIAEIRHDITHTQRQIASMRGRRPLTAKEIESDREWHERREQNITRLQQGLSLLDRPNELRSVLQATADRNRIALKLDRARPVAELMIRRRRQRQRAPAS